MPLLGYLSVLLLKDHGLEEPMAISLLIVTAPLEGKFFMLCNLNLIRPLISRLYSLQLTTEDSVIGGALSSTLISLYQ